MDVQCSDPVSQPSCLTAPLHRSKVRASEERPYGSLRVAVRRDHLFEDSFRQLRSRSASEMRHKLSVSFQGEEGIDAGGVSREWYQVRPRSAPG